MPSPTMTRIRDNATGFALAAEQQNYEAEDRDNAGAYLDVRDMTAAGEALGKALAKIKRTLDRCNLTEGHSFDPVRELELIADSFPVHGKIIELAALDVLVGAPAVKEAA